MSLQFLRVVYSIDIVVNHISSYTILYKETILIKENNVYIQTFYHLHDNIHYLIKLYFPHSRTYESTVKSLLTPVICEPSASAVA